MSFAKLPVDDAVVRIGIVMLKQMAERQHIPERIVKAMQFRIDCRRSIERMQYIVRIGWRDPDDGQQVRALDMAFDDRELQSQDRMEDLLRMNLEQLNLRGELFFFKLHRHFPNRIKNVKCDPHGRVTVIFNNGRELSVDESAIDSTEFLATCGMVYDL